MDLFAGSEKTMSMDEAVWMRHASPWSVWTRFLTVVPLLSLAIWSRIWFSWYLLIPIALAIFWAWYNPRAFSPPQSTDNWASKGVFGERVFLAHRKQDLPAHHLRAVNVIVMLSFTGAIAWIFGLYTLNLSATVAGVIGVVLPKAWFVEICDCLIGTWKKLIEYSEFYCLFPIPYSLFNFSLKLRSGGAWHFVITSL